MVGAFVALGEKGGSSGEIVGGPSPVQCLRQLAPVIEARSTDVLCAQTSHGGEANPSERRCPRCVYRAICGAQLLRRERHEASTRARGERGSASALSDVRPLRLGHERRQRSVGQRSRRRSTREARHEGHCPEGLRPRLPGGLHREARPCDTAVRGRAAPRLLPESPGGSGYARRVVVPAGDRRLR